VGTHKTEERPGNKDSNIIMKLGAKREASAAASRSALGRDGGVASAT